MGADLAATTLLTECLELSVATGALSITLLTIVPPLPMAANPSTAFHACGLVHPMRTESTPVTLLARRLSLIMDADLASNTLSTYVLLLSVDADLVPSTAHTLASLLVVDADLRPVTLHTEGCPLAMLAGPSTTTLSTVVQDPIMLAHQVAVTLLAQTKPATMLACGLPSTFKAVVFLFAMHTSLHPSPDLVGQKLLHHYCMSGW